MGTGIAAQGLYQAFADRFGAGVMLLDWLGFAVNGQIYPFFGISCVENSLADPFDYRHSNGPTQGLTYGDFDRVSEHTGVGPFLAAGQGEGRAEMGVTPAGLR